MGKSMMYLFAATLNICCIGAANADGNATAGKSKTTYCVACHGINGISLTPVIIPSLAGQNTDYLLAQLRAFKSREREGAASAWKHNLSEQDMADLAAYYSSLSPS